MSHIEIQIPNIGDFKEAEVIDCLVKIGDTIQVNQSILTVKCDKVNIEIPSSHAGIVTELKVNIGSKIVLGMPIMVLELKNTTTLDAVSLPNNLSTSFESSVVNNLVQSDVSHKFHASPSVRKFAREFGIKLHQVIGSGPKNRILHKDVQMLLDVKSLNYQNFSNSQIKCHDMHKDTPLNQLSTQPIDLNKFGNSSLRSLSRIKKISGNHLHQSWSNIPHVTQFNEIDVTDLEEFRKCSNQEYVIAQKSIKLTMLIFVIKAIVYALQKFPELNSELDAACENIILKHFYNIGFAVDTPHGLYVPVIKDVDKKSLSQIAVEVYGLSTKAYKSKLQSIDIRGGTFTISSLGGIGGTAFTPIINAPEVAILGISKLMIKPVWNGKNFLPRSILPVSLAYDHRVIDGALGARFVVYLSSLLNDLRKLLL